MKSNEKRELPPGNLWHPSGDHGATRDDEDTYYPSTVTSRNTTIND